MRGHGAWTGAELLVRSLSGTVLLETSSGIFFFGRLSCIVGFCAMSRCFPFPPPGYEKKAGTDDVDLLKKEKHREKKSKKEKKDKDKRESREKDKEKRESKEKSEKDRSDGKHREKKDKKEKHRDKKKDKEKDRDTVKDKVIITDDKRIPGKTQSHGAGKLVNNEFKVNFVDKRDVRQVGGCQTENPSQNHHLAEEKQNSELVELGWRNKDEARGVGNQLVEKGTESDQKKDEGMVRLVPKATDILAEVKGRNKEKRVDDGQAVKGVVSVGGNTMVQNPAVMVDTKVEGIPRAFESNVDRKIFGKEKTKEKQGDDRRGDKSRDKDREKRKQGKDKDKDKEKKKEAKQKEKNEYKNSEPNKEKRKEEKRKEKDESQVTEPDKFKKINKEDHVDSRSIIPSQLSKDSNTNSGADTNLKKRKDLKQNGVLHANDLRPSKLPRASSSFHPVTVNGRTVEPCQTSIPYVSDRLVAANNVKVDNKDRKINGITEAPSLPVSLAKPPHRAAQVDLVAEAPMRPPHPDSKYLGHIYLVPKEVEVPDYDDQDWLSGCSDTQSKKPTVEFLGVEEIPQVWSEALRIESADVHVLPYVIPY